VCEEGEEGGGEDVGQNRLNWHSDEDIAWFWRHRSKNFHQQHQKLSPKTFTATASAKKLGVRGHGGVTASREATMLV
jgi:hypothetical protein